MSNNNDFKIPVRSGILREGKTNYYDEDLQAGAEVIVPRNDVHGKAGTASGPYGNFKEQPIFKYNEEFKAFSLTDKTTLPDSLKYANNDADFLQKKYEERERARQEKEKLKKQQEQQQMIQQDTQATQPSAHSAEHINKTAEATENTGAFDDAYAEYLKTLQGMKVTEEQHTNTDTEAQAPVQSMFHGETTEEETKHSVGTDTPILEHQHKKTASMRTPMGTISFEVRDVVELPQFIVTFFDKDNENFIPIESKKEDEYSILEYNNKKYELYYTGNRTEIPGTNITMQLYIKRVE